MLRIIITTALLLCMSSFASAQYDPLSRLQKLIDQNKSKRTVEVFTYNTLDKLRTPQSEVEAAILFLSRVDGNVGGYSQEDAQYIKFFSTYAIPPSEREDYVLTLSFIIHSLVGVSTDPVHGGGAGAYYPLAVRENGVFKSYRRVPSSETLWWIDLRELNWTPAAWEIVSLGDGYFAEPIVTHDRSGILRLLSGNAVLRADWFIRHAMDSAAQLDIDNKNDFYGTLLYAQTKRPTNVNEWRVSWGLNLTNARVFGNEFGTLVTKSKTVALHNRMLFGYKTHMGYIYESYDVKNEHGRRDYLESLFLNKLPGRPPEVSDAGEMFASNILGLQVYALRNAVGDLVDFGDPSVVRHVNDILGDVRVRVAHSCLDCHASGPIPSENTLIEFIREKAKLKTFDKRNALRLKRNLLSLKFRDSVADNQVLFARAVRKTNGLATEENGRLYLQAVLRYEQPVTLAVAAYECGVTVQELRDAVENTPIRFGARLKLLCRTGESIPRGIWESPGKDGIPGAFQQAMILLNGVTVLTDEELLEEEITIFTVKVTGAAIQAGTKQLFKLEKDYELLPTGKIVDGKWVEVYNQAGIKGYVQLKYLLRTKRTRQQVYDTFTDPSEGMSKDIIERVIGKSGILGGGV